MIPQDKVAAVTRALDTAFGVSTFDDAQDLTKRPGSNRAYRILVRDAFYFLRINTRPSDMARHFKCTCGQKDQVCSLDYPPAHGADQEQEATLAALLEAAQGQFLCHKCGQLLKRFESDLTLL